MLDVTEVAARLNAELGEVLQVRAGHDDYRRTPSGFWSVHPQRLGGRVAHLITVSWGLPPAPELRGLAWGLDSLGWWLQPAATPRWVGRTDARGQCWVHGLPPGEYHLAYAAQAVTRQTVAVLAALADREAIASLEAARASVDQTVLSLGRSRERLLSPFSLSDPPHGVRLHNGWLRVERDHALEAKVPLVRVVVSDESGGESAPAFLAFAQVRLDDDPKTRVWAAEADTRRLFPGPADPAALIRLIPQPVESLAAVDHGALLRSIDAASPRCRAGLVAALGWVRHVFCGRLPAAGVGLPLEDSGAVAAVLPTDPAALRGLARRALTEVHDPGLPNGNLVARAGAWAFGQAVLDRYDRLRWFDAVTAELVEAIRRALPPDTAAATDTALDTPTTFATCVTRPAEVRQRLDRLAELENADADSALAALLYRLTEFAEKPVEQSAEVLGLSVEGAKLRRKAAANFLANKAALPG